MAHDLELADRVRRVIGKMPGVVEKKMFGGVAWLVHGNMSVGIHKDQLIVRLDPADAQALLEQDGVRVFDITGRPMKGWLMVGPDACGDASSLAVWVDRGVRFARTLPRKDSA